MTYNVFGGTLSLTQSINQSIRCQFFCADAQLLMSNDVRSHALATKTWCQNLESNI